jgi:hypothetical protein
MFRHLFLLLCLLPAAVFGQSVISYIPEQCKQLVPYVKSEAGKFMPAYPHQPYFSSLMEHESCIHLKHKRCCSPKSEFVTARERGAGVGMLTIAYRADGSVRFDALTDLRNKYKNHLHELSWNNITSRPDLQVRGVILLFKDSHDRLLSVKDSFERTKMADSAYNGGISAVLKARVACGIAKECDPQKWEKNTERYIVKSTKALYAGRSALDINLHHVKDVTIVRYGKYVKYYSEF